MTLVEGIASNWANHLAFLTAAALTLLLLLTFAISAGYYQRHMAQEIVARLKALAKISQSTASPLAMQATRE